MRNEEFIKSMDAGAAIAAHRIVVIGSVDDAAIQAAAATDQLLGVANEMGADSGGLVDVVLAGIAQVELGGTVTRGDRLTADADGKAVKATKLSEHATAVIAGGAAGDHVVTGITTDDTLISVIHLIDDTGITGAEDLTDEFTISDADEINNAAGTDTTGGTLIITYLDASNQVQTIGIAWVSGVSGDIGSVLIDRNQL